MYGRDLLSKSNIVSGRSWAGFIHQFPIHQTERLPLMKLREENSASIALYSYSNAILSSEEACPYALSLDRSYLFVFMRYD